MKYIQKHKLIEGRFSPKDAKEILMNIFSSKIQFHKMKNFSSQERIGESDETALTRIPQLEISKEEITKLIEEAQLKNLTIAISAEVNLSLSDN